MAYSVVYGDPIILAGRGLRFDQAVARADLMTRDGRPSVRVVDDDGRVVRHAQPRPS
jgi:hypothetical protein